MYRVLSGVFIFVWSSGFLGGQLATRDLPPLAVVGIHPHRPERDWPSSTDWVTSYDDPPRS